ncbi:MAG TPA: hypothetical protein DEG17_19690 [Cyanobacteria bacterium UBA11149]|nr:hypothetical protein [Cyanobacteria bacterium UBA11367]HBE57278.1 hypothetical protein [Cyanobacteria bacterium UBA11366]HBK63108.1 hypothetical protein [Cyanobacteria bacterium UBA11166]HBR76454.1 hypothetical protein [Cyanobacteria bacterium UBA11159]HBS71696.1 hypothetical protein [Cyanobacteria bacterium UBA11153]HBW91023.1 hypothetical protein [Cyanobacteria bacterium UBA11149]HCA96508.1 hypothetical protein [Cyanobacteria bacterium UBA9226]
MADLTGTWLGTYWQSEIPTRFEATLLQSSNTLTGNILDDSESGEATLIGEVIGRRIQFTKRYLTISSAPIHYSGTVNEEEDFIQGDWNIQNNESGKWEARRGGDNLMMELQKLQQQQIPALAGGRR